jgi:hypothetical protein
MGRLPGRIASRRSATWRRMSRRQPGRASPWNKAALSAHQRKREILAVAQALALQSGRLRAAIIATFSRRQRRKTVASGVARTATTQPCGNAQSVQFPSSLTPSDSRAAAGLGRWSPAAMLVSPGIAHGQRRTRGSIQIVPGDGSVRGLGGRLGMDEEKRRGVRALVVNPNETMSTARLFT